MTSPETSVRASAIQQYRRLLSISLIVLAWATAAFAFGEDTPDFTSAAPTLSEEQMREDLRQLVETTKSAWAYAQHKKETLGVDLDRLHEAASERLKAAKSARDFYGVIRELVSDLQDGHAWAQAPWDTGEHLLFRRWPFHLEIIDGRFIVNRVVGDSQAVKLGDELLSVNEQPIQVIHEKCMRTTSASTPGGRAHLALRSVRYTADEKIRIVVRRPDGKEVREEIATSFIDASEYMDAPIEWRTLESGFGYLRLPSFLQDWSVFEAGGSTPEALVAALANKKEKLKEAFVALAAAPGMVLDLRDNGGGSDLLGHYLAQFLCDVELRPRYYELQTHISDELLALPEFESLKQVSKTMAGWRSPVPIARDPAIKRYPGRVAILMNEGSFSATDCFLNYIRCSAPEIALVGRPNGAGAGAPRILMKLKHSGVEVGFCIMRVWNPEGDLLESRPIAPHVPVSRTREDAISGRDIDVEAAEGWLRSALKK